ncbi:unnamed protein product [Onchocerca flexuosa]|uniref:Transposase n=1 Tax=Onchocerca flexuosa TaxID=387005 RepID=A0A183HD20_9BILA|nr:unnamed protein product [Onchocerca flexuosa]
MFLISKHRWYISFGNFEQTKVCSLISAKRLESLIHQPYGGLEEMIWG